METHLSQQQWVQLHTSQMLVNYEFIKTLDILQILLHFVAGVGGILIVSSSELIKNRNVKKKYESEYGFGTWQKRNKEWLKVALTAVLLSSVINSFTKLNTGFLITTSVGIVAYISAQMLETDLKLLLMDRYVLRIGYIANFAIGLILIFTNKEALAVNALGFFTAVITLVVLFLIVNINLIGMSDIRAMGVTAPLSMLYLGNEIGGLFYFGIFIVLYVYQKRKERRTGSISMLPMGPGFLIPYAVIFTLLSIFG